MRLLTTAPTGATARRRFGQLEARYVRVPVPRALARRGMTVETAFAAPVLAATLATRADLVHCWLYGDAYGAGLARRLRRRPTVLKLTGTVKADRVAGQPLDDRMLRSALAAADEVWCNSAFAHAEMAEFGVPMQIVPAGVDTTLFTPGDERSAAPTVLVTAAADDPRKRVVDVVAAWPAVCGALPGARLRLAGHVSEATRGALLERLPPALRPTVAFLGVLDAEDLVTEYRAAWVCVTPSVFEALGLVTLEALACGTPVAGARSGATPDLLAAEGTGALYAPADPRAAADAIVRAAGLALDPLTRQRCRDAAAPYDWEPIVDLVERRYDAVLARR